MRGLIAIFLCFAFLSCSQAPTFYDLHNNPVRFKHFAGRYKVLHYWASWCKPCIHEIQIYNQLHQQYQDQGITVIGVNYDMLSETKLRKLVQKYDVKFPTITIDPAASLAIKGIAGLPTTFIINQQGKIVRKLQGVQSQETLSAVIAELP